MILYLNPTIKSEDIFYFSWVVFIDVSDLTHENLETFVIFSWVIFIELSNLTHENLDDNILLENCKKIVSNHRHSIVELSGSIYTALVIPGCLVYVLSSCFWTSLHGDSITKNRGGKSTINYFYPYNILLFLFHYN